MCVYLSLTAVWWRRSFDRSVPLLELFGGGVVRVGTFSSLLSSFCSSRLIPTILTLPSPHTLPLRSLLRYAMAICRSTDSFPSRVRWHWVGHIERAQLRRAGLGRAEPIQSTLPNAILSVPILHRRDPDRYSMKKKEKRNLATIPHTAQKRPRYAPLSRPTEKAARSSTNSDLNGIGIRWRLLLRLRSGA